MTRLVWRESGSAAACAEALAAAVADRLRSDVAGRGAASLVVSGGSTPVPFFAALANQELDWRRVQVTLADERWVPPDSPDSNEGLVRERLLTRHAGGARLVGLWRATATPELAIAGATGALQALARPFSAVVLGMGLDGHTASLFPGGPAAGLDPEAPALLVAAQPTGAPHARMSLTLRALLDTSALFLHITGAAKRALLEQAVLESSPLPIAVVARHHALDVYYAP